MAPTLKRLASTDRDISPPPAKRKVLGTTTAGAVSSFFTPTSQKAPEKVRFHIVQDTVLNARYEGATAAMQCKPVKFAAFDFDDTLITTKSGNKFARGSDDWRWWHATVSTRLKQLHADGYKIVVLSNQAAVSLRADPKTPKDGMRSLNNLKGKVAAVLNTLDLPISVYAATGYDTFRKPRSGMWDLLLKDYALSEPSDVDHDACLFVGDAAGREADKIAGTRKDHACSDRDFADNVNIPFFTPEEYFLGEDPKPFIRSFDPKAHLGSLHAADDAGTTSVFVRKHDIELVLFCGSPGAGKSTYYWQNMQPLGYERVNQDILKTRDKCVAVATHFVEAGSPVVVDNTNADIETRAVWVSLAKKLGITVRLVLFNVPAKLCEHNSTVRALTAGLMNPEKREMLPKIAFTSFASRYRQPKLDEGFEDMTPVNFKFEGTAEQLQTWSRFWIS